MDRQPKTERLDAGRPEDIARAAQILRNGGLVAFPTETVYGLGANALSAEAVERIFLAKQRPHWDPLIVHVCDLEMLNYVRHGLGFAHLLQSEAPARPPRLFSTKYGPVEMPPGPQDIWEMAREEDLIRTFWPGPLTLLRPRTRAIPNIVTAGRPLVAVRMPAHLVALKLIRQADLPIAAPSANTFGHTSPTTAEHVLADLDGRIDAVLDGGPTQLGLESTVAEIRSPGMIVYRPGAVTIPMLESIGLRGQVTVYQPASSEASPSAPAPGLELRHYAPRARLVLVEDASQLFASLRQALLLRIENAAEPLPQLGVMLPDGWSAAGAGHIFSWGPWLDGDVLASRLFAGLRDLDNRGATTILCPVPDVPGIGEAIRDRLQRAAAE